MLAVYFECRQTVVSQFVVSITFSLGTIAAANGMHSMLLSSVMRLAMSFFDVTPIGRILNRFSKDIDVCDNTLPQVLRMFIAMSFGVSFICLLKCLHLNLFVKLQNALRFTCFYSKVSTQHQLQNAHI